MICVKVFASAEAFGFRELVDFDSRTRRFEPSKQLEDELESTEYVSRYEEETFWHELARCLSEKYLLEMYGEDRLRSLSRDELFLKRMAMDDQISEALERDGLRNLTLSGFVPDRDRL